jgi:hypothetical protein
VLLNIFLTFLIYSRKGCEIGRRVDLLGGQSGLGNPDVDKLLWE